MLQDIRTQPAKFWIAATLVIAVLSIVSVVETHASPPDRGDSMYGKSLNLRDVFYSDESTEVSPLVARVSIMLIDSSGSREVRVDHQFRSGDRFRFLVSSNHAGWLYILHRSPTGKVKQLWPRQDSKTGSVTNQKIEVGQSYLIPPSPGKFFFGGEAGQEEFIVAVQSQKTPPDLELLEAVAPEQLSSTGTSVLGQTSDSATFAPPRKKAIGNIVIREPHSGELTRTTFFDPGTEDSDPRLYFSTATGDGATAAIVKFKLRHAK